MNSHAMYVQYTILELNVMFCEVNNLQEQSALCLRWPTGVFWYAACAYLMQILLAMAT